MTWEEKTGFIINRILETVQTILISSLPIYLLVISGIIPNTKACYAFIFGISAIVYLWQSSIALYRHFWNISFNIGKYLSVNLSIALVVAALNYLVMKNDLDHLYTAFFGYTKPFRAMYDISDMRSSAVFWVIYLILMLAVIIKTFFFDWKYKDLCDKKDMMEEEENWA